MRYSRLVSRYRFLKPDEDQDERESIIEAALMPSATDVMPDKLNVSKPNGEIRLLPEKESFMICPWNVASSMTKQLQGGR